jgi:hypothetical protein
LKVRYVDKDLSCCALMHPSECRDNYNDVLYVPQHQVFMVCLGIFDAVAFSFVSDCTHLLIS